MTRETATNKARRYLGEGRLLVYAVSGDFVSATCRGDGEIHRLGHDPGRGWFCSYAARTDQCAHLTALRLVAVRTSRLHLAASRRTA